MSINTAANGRRNGASTMDAILDRMATVAGAGAATRQEQQAFLPSLSWQGARLGYYFGTGSHGTGYYLDICKHQQREQQHEASSKRKRSVRIAEENNELRLMPKTDLLEQAEKDASGSTIVELTPKGIQSAANALTKIANHNAMQRAQFADQPRQYMESELALYEQVTALQAIAADAQLYQSLVENESLLSTLIELLSHDNTDVCASVIALFFEWIDPALLADDSDFISTLAVLASRILEDAWETIVSDLLRFSQHSGDDAEDTDMNKDKDIDIDMDSHDQSLRGIDNALSLMENLLELDLIVPDGLLGPQHDLSAAAFMVQETKIVSWFFQTLQSERTTTEIKGRCFELLAFIAQREDVHAIMPDWSRLPPVFDQENVPIQEERHQNKKMKREPEPIQGIEIMLQSIGAYRKTQPKNDSEIEFIENACITLSSCITFSAFNLKAFLDGQGIELALRCLKERVHAGASCLKLLDFFGSDQIHKRACERLVNAGVFKYIFPIFLNSRIPKPAPSQAKTTKTKREWLHNIETQTIRILYALSHHLDDDSPDDAKARFLTKFVEDDRKCDRLVELLLSYDQKAQKAEYNFYRSDVEEVVQEEETIQLAALEAKLKGGGDLFHRLGATASFLCVHSKRCHERILSQLQLRRSGISLVRTAVDDFESVLGDEIQKGILRSYLERL